MNKFTLEFPKDIIEKMAENIVIDIVEQQIDNLIRDAVRYEVMHKDNVVEMICNALQEDDECSLNTLELKVWKMEGSLYRAVKRKVLEMLPDAFVRELAEYIQESEAKDDS